MLSAQSPKTTEEKILPVGGQAVIEGVMMRSPERLATAVRRANGTVELKIQEYQSLFQRHKWLNIPVIRGAIMLIEVMILGIQHLNFSADVAMMDENLRTGKGDSQSPKGMSRLSTAFTVGFALLAGLALFFALPLFTATQFFNVEKDALAFNLISGGVRVTLFLAYIWGISFLKDVKRLFQYHGAEHKTIFAFEKGLPLTVENVRKQGRLHPRCGTSFLMMVMLISVIFFALVDSLIIYATGSINLLTRLAVHLPLVSLVGGLSYEAIKASAKKPDHPIVKLLIAPGLALQRITTQEPDDSMLEVAIISLLAALGDPYEHLLPQNQPATVPAAETFL